jgi:predicted phage terminase large subunit-like protein
VAAIKKPEKIEFPKLTRDIVLGFAGSCIVPYLDNASQFGKFHEEILELACSDDKFLAMALPRGHGKSTIITIIYVLACVLFRQRKYVLIVADTEGQATLFLGQIKQILYDSQQIRDLFGLALDDKGLVKFEKDTETDVIMKFQDGGTFRITAKGAEQRLRGLMFNGQRPDLIIMDDMMSDEAVMNKDRREKLNKWIYGSLIPCRSETGIIRFIGTLLNLDDALARLMPHPHSRDTVHEELKMYSKKKKGMWCSVLYRAHNEDMSVLLWPERKTVQAFKELREDFTEQGIPEVYSCEYLNNPVDDSIRYFRKTDFLPLTEEDKKKNLTYYITADLAISLKERADYTAIVVGGMDSNGQLHIRNVVRERLTGDEIVDTLMALQKVYKPQAIGIEDGQISKALGPYINRAMMETGNYMNIVALKPHRMDKLMRARAIQARMRASAVKFDTHAEWYPQFLDECLSFPRARHDDVVDALSYQGILIDRMSEGLSVEEKQDEEYEEEYTNSDMANQGRNADTGY